MSNNSLIYFMLWILLQALAEVNCQMTPIIERGHSTTLIDNKLYILGGKDKNAKYVGKELYFFYLDVSTRFNTNELLSLWQDLSKINTILPPHGFAVTVKGGANNNTLILYGGTSDQPMDSLVYTFDPQSNTWSIPEISKVNAIKKLYLTGINHNGKMYLWSGWDKPNVYFNDMLILDTINFSSWGKGSVINAPTPRYLYGATLLPDNKIIYMGGINTEFEVFGWDKNNLNINKGDALTLNEVYIYDIIGDNWSTKTTSGKIPSNRAVFTVILGLDGQRIIIFGGAFINPGYLDTSLYELDLKNFVWSVPKVTGKIPKPIKQT
ncbi:hypothetical protein C1645_738564 [Glomus cerebriforme]|uniref:Galactose oxidase n=1 Tax=Glomus cerebriforme TaxID=658196 RepID=A0A397STW7_9GLOM|nr:hypothetical protein C1645_738564 [Glomus cerebriforme]